MQNITHNNVKVTSQTDISPSRIPEFSISRDSTLSADKRDRISVTVRPMDAKYRVDYGLPLPEGPKYLSRVLLEAFVHVCWHYADAWITQSI